MEEARCKRPRDRTPVRDSMADVRKCIKPQHQQPWSVRLRLQLRVRLTCYRCDKRCEPAAFARRVTALANPHHVTSCEVSCASSNVLVLVTEAWGLCVGAPACYV